MRFSALPAVSLMVPLRVPNHSRSQLRVDACTSEIDVSGPLIKSSLLLEVRGDNKLPCGTDCETIDRQTGTNVPVRPNSVTAKPNSDSNSNSKASLILFRDADRGCFSCQGKLRFIGEAEASGPSPSSFIPV